MGFFEAGFARTGTVSALSLDADCCLRTEAQVAARTARWIDCERCCSIDDSDNRTLVLYNSRVIAPACTTFLTTCYVSFPYRSVSLIYPGSVSIGIEPLPALARLQEGAHSRTFYAIFVVFVVPFGSLAYSGSRTR